jgi:hypothetical protein
MSDARPDLMIIFGEALERADPADRAPYLERACGSDAALRERVDSLLAVHAGTGSVPGLANQTGPANQPDPATHALAGETHAYTGRDPEMASSAQDGAATAAFAHDDPNRTALHTPVPARRQGRSVGGDRGGIVSRPFLVVCQSLPSYLTERHLPLARECVSHGMAGTKQGSDSMGHLPCP